MATYYTKTTPAVLTAAQRTSLLTLLQSIYGGALGAADIKRVVFERDGGGVVTGLLVERAQPANLAAIPDGATIEQA